MKPSYRRSIATCLTLSIAVLGIFIFLSADPAHQPPTEPAQPSPTPPVTTNPPQSTSATPTAHSQVRFRPRHPTRKLQILEGPYFTVGYDNQRKNPAWVTYDLDGPIAFQGGAPTRPLFATDFRTSAHVAHRDYTNSGFDRGHLAPAFAMWSRYGKDAFIATFTCSNIVPQHHEMNAGIWEDLEDDIAGGVRQGGGWADKYRNLTIINGPIYDDHPATLKSGIQIPSSCFSIVFDWQENLSTYRSLAFVIPNERSAKGPLGRWLTTISRIEKATGLDVFAGEAEGLRASMEDALAGAVWAE